MNNLAKQHCMKVDKSTPPLTAGETRKLKEEVPGWETNEKMGEMRLEKTFKFKDFKSALAFTDQVGKLADQEDHHPALLTEWGKVTVTWWTHTVKGLSNNDFIMAAKTEQLSS